MKSKIGFTRKDVFVAFCCTIFLLAALGAVGNGGRRRAKEAVCFANLKRWGTVFVALANDNGGQFLSRTAMRDWPETLQPYYVQSKLLLCPEARKTYQEGALNPFMAWLSDGYRGSYVINNWISNAGGDYWKTPYVAHAGQVPMLLDGQWREMQPYPADEPPMFETDLWTPGPMNEIRRACVGRHNGAVTAVFLDGSVRKVGLKSLWRLKWHRQWDMDFPLPVWPMWMANFKDPQ
jgi:prepilin-type processing-associated H-X9-DG protein